jgi:hypothetical protein
MLNILSVVYRLHRGQHTALRNAVMESSFIVRERKKRKKKKKEMKKKLCIRNTQTQSK